MSLLKKVAGWFLLCCLFGGIYCAQAQERAMPPFDESIWRLDHLEGQKKTIKKHQQDQQYTQITFNPYTHRVRGLGLCNQFYGWYENKTDTLSITHFKAKEAVCLSSEINAQDRKFFNDLQKTCYFSVTGPVLTLMGKNRDPLMIFIRVQ